MKKYLFNILGIGFIFLIIGLAFKNISILKETVLDTSIIFFVKVFPYLFFMMILNNLLIGLNIPFFIFKLSKNPYLYLYIMSILSGSPMNAIIIKDYLDKKILTIKQASILLGITMFNNPLFLYNYFSIIFDSKAISFKLMALIYIPSTILFIIYCLKYKNSSIITYEKVNFIKHFTSSFNKCIINLLNIYSIILFFTIITNLFFKVNTPLTCVFRGLIEITQGLNLLVILSISKKTKEIITLIILLFGGFSIHIQIANNLSNYDIDYKYMYFFRTFLIVLTVAVLKILTI